MGNTSEMFIHIQDDIMNTTAKYDNGDISALDTLLYLRGFKKKAETIIELVKDFENNNIENISSESNNYNGVYKGFEIKKVNGRTSFKFDKIQPIQDLNSKKKEIEDKYKNAFLGYQKGIAQTTDEDGVLKWIDENGELLDFPEITYGSSYITIKETKKWFTN